MFPQSLRLALFLTTTLLTSCTATVHTNCHWATSSWMGDEPKDERHELAIECEPVATTVSTEVRAQGTAGELLLRLVDPDGVERHRQVVRTGETEGRQSWPARVGTWRLFVEPAAFCGSYSITMAATDQPIVIRVRLAEDLRR
ncbi:MAG: hypothetical protein K8J09_07285 [Planctomycetes bacterium]|nr:hypothetical protein [Planctomycetota bacterium]MCC7395852.1 hypothetical protein [Planctomycetota bacterium]